MSLRAGLVASLALTLAACVSTPEGFAPVPRAEAPRFDPFTFFLGTSAGTGTLAMVLSDPVPVRVESSGRILIEPRHEASWDAPALRAGD